MSVPRSVRSHDLFFVLLLICVLQIQMTVLKLFVIMMMCVKQQHERVACVEIVYE